MCSKSSSFQHQPQCLCLFSNDDREPAKTIGPAQGYAPSRDAGRSRQRAEDDAREDIILRRESSAEASREWHAMKLPKRGQIQYVSKDDRPCPRVCAVHGCRQKQTTCRRRRERGHITRREPSAEASRERQAITPPKRG